MMFKSTRNLPAEAFDRLTEDVGGLNNASTTRDYTYYFEVVPANHLERILWAEAERMSNLVVDEASFISEREVVKEELRGGLAGPYGQLLAEDIPRANFVVHPYGRSIKGSIKDLDAATIEEVRAFHALYYRPDNAALVVAGNFSPDDLAKWVDTYFSSITAPKDGIQRLNVIEPVRRGAKEYTVYANNVPLPAISVSYPVPPSGSKDRAAFTVLDEILAKGESSRLNQALVYRQRVATTAYSTFQETREPGAYSVVAVVSAGAFPDSVARTVVSEIRTICTGRVSTAELQRAKNQLLSRALRERETMLGRNLALGTSIMLYGDAHRADRLLGEIQDVTPDDILRVASATFQDTRRITIRYLSAQQRPAGAPATTIPDANTVAPAKLSVPTSPVMNVRMSPGPERSEPPKPAPAVIPELPQIFEHVLSNGLRVVAISKRGLPLVSINLRVMSGTASDPPRLSGLALIVAETSIKGTTARSAPEIAQRMERFGSTSRIEVDADSTSLSLTGLSSHADALLSIVSDAAGSPAYSLQEVERQRSKLLNDLSLALQQPGAIALYAGTRLIFGSHPYGSVPTPKSVSAIGRDDIVAFHELHWRPDNAVLIITGDIAPADAFRMADRYFREWSNPIATARPRPSAQADPPTKPRVIFIDLPGAAIACVGFGLLGVSRLDSRYPAAMLANSVLGGGYSSRLNREIRIRRGLAYFAGSMLDERRFPSLIWINTLVRNEAVSDVLDIMKREGERLGNEPVTADELTARKAALIGEFYRDFETVSGTADRVSRLVAIGLPTKAVSRYAEDVSGVTPDALRQTASHFLDIGKADIIVVGDGSALFEIVSRKYPDAERVSIDRIDFGSPTLK
jgi:zinc protease